MMAATHMFEGAGAVSGVGAIDSTGDSLASLMANGNGEVKMAMAGGDLSAVLVDLTGLQFGNALLSALGVPNKTQVQCFVGDLGMQRGILEFKAMTLDTGEGITNVGGNVDLSKAIALALKTDAKHFSVVAADGHQHQWHVQGPENPAWCRSGGPRRRWWRAGRLVRAVSDPADHQFGTSEAEDAHCGELLQQARASAGGKALPPPLQGASAEH